MRSGSSQRYIHHVTLLTGDTRQSWRHEVDPDVMPVASGMLDRALAGERAAIAGLEGYEITAAAAGGCCLVTAWRGAAPLVTFGISVRSRCGADLWRRLHEDPWTPLATDAQQRPPVPWCAALLQPGIVPALGDAYWLADFERVLAWAFLDRV